MHLKPLYLFLTFFSVSFIFLILGFSFLYGAVGCLLTTGFSLLFLTSFVAFIYYGIILIDKPSR